MKWFLCMRRDAAPRETWTVDRDTHLAWMREMHDAGTIVMSGPVAGGGLALYLIRAADLDAATRVAESDPFTAAGHCRFEILEWRVHQIMGVGAFGEAALGSALVSERPGGDAGR